MRSGRRAFTSPVYSPAAIVRGRLLRLIADRTDLPVRFLCAPVGSGKTTLLRQYVAKTDGARYVRVVPEMTSTALRGMLEAADEASEVLVDDLDAAQPAAVEALIGDIAAGEPSFPRLILAGRARARVHAQRLLARGLAVVFEGGDLAFDRYEVEELADRFGLTHAQDDVTELLQVTEGWPVAVSWILRDASSARGGLLGAFERWSARYGQELIEFVVESLGNDSSLRRAFLDSIAADSAVTQHALAQLESAGCPVARLRTRMRPYRILNLVSRAPEVEREAAVRSPEPLALSLLGRFSCTIAGRQIAFARRRDRTLLVYVALAPGGRVTRDELLEVFWPGITRTIASQGLRTTLSRLRRAIGEAARADADRYLQVDANVSLVLDHVVVDARRFVEHVELGRLADARGDAASACRHFRTACGLYKDHLLTSEAIETPLAGHVKEFESLFKSTLIRLAELIATETSGEREAIALRLRALRTSA